MRRFIDAMKVSREEKKEMGKHKQKKTCEGR